MYSFLNYSADKNSNKIYIYDGQGSSTPLHILESLHTKPIVAMRFNSTYETVISVDNAGILEYWMNSKHDYRFPQKIVNFESKLDTSMLKKYLSF